LLVPESLLGFVLRLLGRIAEPVVAPDVVAAYPAEALSELTLAGILKETSRASEIVRPLRYGPGPDLSVRVTALGLYGVAADPDEYCDPVPLSDDDARRYAVSIPRLAAELRQRNQIQGAGCEMVNGLALLGSKRVQGHGGVPVYISLPNGDHSVFLARCLRARRGQAGLTAVVIAPEEISLPTESRRILDESGIRTAALSPAARLADLEIDWTSIFSEIPAREAAPPRFLFQKNGDFWNLAFEGKSISVRDSKGLVYIAELLRRPAQEIFAAELFAAANGMKTVPVGSSGAMLDETAVRSYRQRAADLQFQLAEAEKNNDRGGQEAAQLELERLTDEILAGRGLSGRRRNAQDDSDRIRKSVSNAIGRAVDMIREHAPPLAHHLDRHLRRGHFASYSGNIFWEF
jgi:hypothetical protein